MVFKNYYLTGRVVTITLTIKIVNTELEIINQILHGHVRISSEGRVFTWWTKRMVAEESF